ncbi:hypothetical protein AAZX31_20G054800 [Glycine max]
MEKNYPYWSYVMKNFLKGKRMWGYVGGTFVKMETWEVNNSKITTQINNYVLQTIGMQVEKYDLAKAIWDHLKMLNNSILLCLICGIELALNKPTELQALKVYTNFIEQQRLVQFFMALQDDFEGLRWMILRLHPLPNVDVVVNELLAEEIQLKSNSSSDKGIFFASPPVFVALFTKVSLKERKFKALSSNVVVVPNDGHKSTSDAPSQVVDLVEQFKKLLATQSLDMSASSLKGLPSSSSLG